MPTVHSIPTSAPSSPATPGAIPTDAPGLPEDPEAIGVWGVSTITIQPVLANAQEVTINGPETGVSIFDAFTTATGTLPTACTHVLISAVADCFTLLGLNAGQVAVYARGYFEDSLVGNVLVSQNAEMIITPLIVS